MAEYTKAPHGAKIVRSIIRERDYDLTDDWDDIDDPLPPLREEEMYEEEEDDEE